MLQLKKEYLQLTPVQYMKDNLKLPSRKLWEKKNVKMEFHGESWDKPKASDKNDNTWDTIESPQFVDFSNLPEKGDSFFTKSRVIVSTPLPNIGEDTKTDESDSTLIAYFKRFGLSTPNFGSPIVTSKSTKDHQENAIIQEKCEAQDTQVDSKATPQIWDKMKKPQNTVLYPFTFDLREKHKKKDDQQKLKTVPENEKDNKVFRANPLPRYLKSRIANKENNKDNEKMIKNPSEKAQITNNSNKMVKKKIELWRKPPFIPCPIKKTVEHSKPPLLRTAVRAQERKRFDEALQEKEKQREQMKQMENALKKKQEEDAIAQLRKQIVFKAQPVPKFRVILPKVEKRPLTDPTSPITLKRRRKLVQTQV